MHTTHETSTSFLTRFLQHLISPFRPHLVSPKKKSPAGSPRLKVHRTARKRCHHVERQVQGIWIYDLSPSRPQESLDTLHRTTPKQTMRIYYFAGGGWQQPPSSQHWKLCAELCHRLPNAVISIVSYPLAPASPAPVAFPHLLKLSKELLRTAADDYENVILAGDSSGANIALSLAVEAARLASRGLDGFGALQQVSAVLAISPCVNVGPPSVEAMEIDKHDPVLSVPFTQDVGKSWAAEWSVDDTRVSPLRGTLDALSMVGTKIIGVTGGNDVLSPDAVSFRNRCAEARVEGEWLQWDHQMHCFPLTWCYGLPEGKKGLQWISEALERSG